MIGWLVYRVYPRLCAGWAGRQDRHQSAGSGKSAVNLEYMNFTRYVVITPVRDEEKHLPQTIESMASQTIRPAFWVIVNDGSSDNTGDVADAAAAKHSWIRVVH